MVYRAPAAAMQLRRSLGEDCKNIVRRHARALHAISTEEMAQQRGWLSDLRQWRGVGAGEHTAGRQCRVAQLSEFPVDTTLRRLINPELVKVVWSHERQRLDINLVLCQHVS